MVVIKGRNESFVVKLKARLPEGVLNFEKLLDMYNEGYIRSEVIKKLT